MPSASPQVPDIHGRFGPYGGRYVPETLMLALRQLTEQYEQARDDPEFQQQFDYYLRHYVGRPSPLYFAERLTKEAGGARIFLKREDLNHTGAHKINNCIGQALLTKRMGKPRIIAETGAGQHGVATRHRRGAVRLAVPGLHGRGGRPPAEAQRLQDEGAWAPRSSPSPAAAGPCATPSTRRCATGWRRVANTHYIIGSVVGPHPFPMMVRDFQSVIGQETKQQCHGADRPAAGRRGRLRRRRQQRGRHVLSVRRRCRRRAGRRRGRRPRRRRRASTPPRSATASPACCTARSAMSCRTTTARPPTVHSVSAGLDYPGVGPEHSYWKDTGRVRYTSVGDDDALKAFRSVLPAGRHSAGAGDGPRRRRGDAHRRRSGAKEDVVVVCFSGRGDKDCFEVARLRGETL